ncbi:MAG TPA: condensation domain-containing protein, partial [Ktedonobacteraceae bacterium]
MSDLARDIEKLSPAKRALLLKRLRTKEVSHTPIRLNQQRREAGNVPLSFAQERLWFQVQMEPEAPFYTLAAAFALSGDLQIEALAQSLHELVRRHESLRTHFSLLAEHPVQV